MISLWSLSSMSPDLTPCYLFIWAVYSMLCSVLANKHSWAAAQDRWNVASCTRGMLEMVFSWSGTLNNCLLCDLWGLYRALRGLIVNFCRFSTDIPIFSSLSFVQYLLLCAWLCFCWCFATRIYLLYFYVHVTVHRNKFLCNKTNQMHQFPKFTPAWNSTCFGQFLCPSSGVYSLYTWHWCMSYKFEDSFQAGPGPGWKLSSNLGKFVPLVGFIIRVLAVNKHIAEFT